MYAWQDQKKALRVNRLLPLQKDNLGGSVQPDATEKKGFLARLFGGRSSKDQGASSTAPAQTEAEVPPASELEVEGLPPSIEPQADLPLPTPTPHATPTPTKTETLTPTPIKTETLTPTPTMTRDLRPTEVPTAATKPKTVTQTPTTAADENPTS